MKVHSGRRKASRHKLQYRKRLLGTWNCIFLARMVRHWEELPEQTGTSILGDAQNSDEQVLSNLF